MIPTVPPYRLSLLASGGSDLRHQPLISGTAVGGRDIRQRRGVTLVEAMISVLIMGMFMLGFMGAFIQSRRKTEAAVLHAAATSVVYGIIEQIKALDYATGLPYCGDGISTNNPDFDSADPDATDGNTQPFIRVRINQNTMKWLKVVYTQAPDTGTATPSAPTFTPGPWVDKTAVGLGSGAIDNYTGPLALSTVTGSTSQYINLNLWVWVDEVPDSYVTELKRVTIIYSYEYRDGSSLRRIRNREVFLRSRFDQ